MDVVNGQHQDIRKTYSPHHKSKLHLYLHSTYTAPQYPLCLPESSMTAAMLPPASRNRLRGQIQNVTTTVRNFSIALYSAHGGWFPLHRHATPSSAKA
jgi:hypothetical protein